MMGLVWTPSTIVVALVIAVLAVLAVRRIATRGLCDCHDHCGDSDSPKRMWKLPWLFRLRERLSAW